MKVNIDESPDITSKYDIMSIPTLMIFKNGEKVSESIIRKKNLNGDCTQHREWGKQEQMHSFCSDRHHIHTKGLVLVQ